MADNTEHQNVVALMYPVSWLHQRTRGAPVRPAHRPGRRPGAGTRRPGGELSARCVLRDRTTDVLEVPGGLVAVVSVAARTRSGNGQESAGPGLCRHGPGEWESGPLTSSPRQRGRTAASRALNRKAEGQVAGHRVPPPSCRGVDTTIDTARLTRDTGDGDPLPTGLSLCGWNEGHSLHSRRPDKTPCRKGGDDGKG